MDYFSAVSMKKHSDSLIHTTIIRLQTSVLQKDARYDSQAMVWKSLEVASIWGKRTALIVGWFTKRFGCHVCIVAFLWEVGTRSYTGAINNSKVPVLFGRRYRTRQYKLEQYQDDHSFGNSALWSRHKLTEALIAWMIPIQLVITTY